VHKIKVFPRSKGCGNEERETAERRLQTPAPHMGKTLNAKTLLFAGFANPAIILVIHLSADQTELNPSSSLAPQCERTVSSQALGRLINSIRGTLKLPYPLSAGPSLLGQWLTGSGCRDLPVIRKAGSDVRAHLCCLYPVTIPSKLKQPACWLTLILGTLGRVNSADFN
jgi:hypothetical protein